tara:strand:- start:7031 stop:7234 length:204 start_codon:yes stop_codon:yes gene_type:complete
MESKKLSETAYEMMSTLQDIGNEAREAAWETETDIPENEEYWKLFEVAHSASYGVAALVIALRKLEW